MSNLKIKPRTHFKTRGGISQSKLFVIAGVAFLVVFAVVQWMRTPIPSRYQESIYDDVIGGTFRNFENEPAARRLYEKMFEVMQMASTLSYTVETSYLRSDRALFKNRPYMHKGYYKTWLEKPKSIRLEQRDRMGEVRTVFVGVDDSMRAYWPVGRPKFPSDTNDEDYQKTRQNVFFESRFTHFIAKIGYLSGGGVRPVLFPSKFFSHAKNQWKHIDAVRGVGEEEVGGEMCDVIEISFLHGQRSHLLWLAKTDHLPRKIKNVVRACQVLTSYETWFNVHLDEHIPNTQFEWNPPENWIAIQVKPPPLPPLLKPGEEAPDFSLTSANGNIIRLKDYRGSVLWLNFWHVGRPQCIALLPLLEETHQKYKNNGLVVLGFDCDDRPEFVIETMQRASVTYPSISDPSEFAQTVARKKYGAVMLPTNYLIDENGKVAASWRGYQQGDKRPLEALQKLGFY